MQIQEATARILKKVIENQNDFTEQFASPIVKTLCDLEQIDCDAVTQHSHDVPTRGRSWPSIQKKGSPKC